MVKMYILFTIGILVKINIEPIIVKILIMAIMVIMVILVIIVIMVTMFRMVRELPHYHDCRLTMTMTM